MNDLLTTLIKGKVEDFKVGIKNILNIKSSEYKQNLKKEIAKSYSDS